MNWLPAFKKSPELNQQEDAIGVAIHQDRVNWIAFRREDGSIRIASHGSVPLDRGAIAHGELVNPAMLIRALSVVRDVVGDRAVHVSFPSDHSSLFTLHIPSGIPLEQVHNMIEYEMETRLPGRSFADIAIQYEVLTDSEEEGKELAVIAYPHHVEAAYAHAFEEAGIRVASFEPTVRSVSRALFSGTEDDALHAVADIGPEHTQLYVVKNGIPVMLSHIGHGDAKVEGVAEDAARRLRQWDARRDSHNTRITPIGRVHIVGSHVHHPDFVDFGTHLGKGMRVATNHGNVWNRLYSFDDYIPPIDRVSSSEYAAAIGIALRDLLGE